MVINLNIRWVGLNDTYSELSDIRNIGTLVTSLNSVGTIGT